MNRWGTPLTERPLVIFAHGGTFFPPIGNGSPFGSRKDSVNVEICTRLAKMGYVAVSFSYRQGWIAISPQAEVKRKTILEAAYRSIQDVRACIRYFRKNAAVDGNGFKVDVNRIAVGGQGTGGYVSYGAAFLKRFGQINLAKFTDFSTAPPTPYIDSMILGDPYGVKMTVFNRPNNATYSSEHHFGFSLTGANGDTSWVEAGDIPYCGFPKPQ